MIKKHIVSIGILISLLLLFISTLLYPGGSQHDKNSAAYDWQHNYISNLFNSKAINGTDSDSPFWAAGGMFFLSASFGLFFIRFSKKIPVKSATIVIKYFGVGAMVFAFMSVTKYHDIMVTVAATLGLVSIFYCTVYIFKSTLHWAKILSVILLISVYACTYLYYTSSYLEALPVTQKSSLGINIIWVLLLEYFSSNKDFNHTSKAIS